MEPWLAKLESGDPVAAWDAFVERYRGLILTTVRHYVGEADDVMDVFAEVCAVLRDDDLARLRRFVREQSRGARVSTWLVAVARNRAIDWVRRQQGRKRPSAAVSALPPLRRRIAEYVLAQQCSHVEAFERLRTNDGADLSFSMFRHELSATYAALDHTPAQRAVREALGPPWPQPEDAESGVAADTTAIIAAALRTLRPDVRAAVHLFVVDEVPATQVARSVGWPNAKAVYNRVYRALADLRAELERAGISRADLETR